MDLNQEFEKLKANLNGKSKIIIISHESPDRDAIGSIVSVKMILNELGFDNVLMLNETKSSVTEGFIEEMKNINYEKLEENIEGTDLIIIVDANAWHRITKASPEIAKDIPKIIIDHHKTEADVENVVQYVKFDYSSNCEGIYHLFHNHVKLNKEIAKPILMGIYDDTGGFKYPGTKASTFEAVIGLMETGLEVSEVAREQSSLSVRLLSIGKGILNNTTFDLERKFFYGYIDRDDIAKYELDYTEVDLIKDIFISMMLEVKEIEWGFLVKPKPNGTCTLSFRSKPQSNIDAVTMAEKLGGGGHKYAAGATSAEEDPEKAMKQVLEKLPN